MEDKEIEDLLLKIKHFGVSPKTEEKILNSAKKKSISLKSFWLSKILLFPCLVTLLFATFFIKNPGKEICSKGDICFREEIAVKAIILKARIERLKRLARMYPGYKKHIKAIVNLEKVLKNVEYRIKDKQRKKDQSFIGHLKGEYENV